MEPVVLLFVSIKDSTIKYILPLESMELFFYINRCFSYFSLALVKPFSEINISFIISTIFLYCLNQKSQDFALFCSFHYAFLMHYALR